MGGALAGVSQLSRSQLWFRNRVDSRCRDGAVTTRSSCYGYYLASRPNTGVSVRLRFKICAHSKARAPPSRPTPAPTHPLPLRGPPPPPNKLYCVHSCLARFLP